MQFITCNATKVELYSTSATVVCNIETKVETKVEPCVLALFKYKRIETINKCFWPQTTRMEMDRDLKTEFRVFSSPVCLFFLKL